MSVRPAIDPEKYAKLLAKTLPQVITNEEENERMLALVEPIFDKGEKITAEEQVLLELLTRLIQDFEDKHYELKASTPRGILIELMEARGVKQNKLWELFGSKGTASEVLSGRRSISKANAKKLAEFFNVSAELFI
jgi:HTH-type transcriptional regulator/antitoxin HigA